MTSSGQPKDLGRESRNALCVALHRVGFTVTLSRHREKR